jgi:large subunit ribosomal protein L15
MEKLGLHNLITAPGSKTKKRRVGRGNASGKGNYSGRGMKGQRARSGGKNKLILKGIKTYLRRIPKNRGFKSFKLKSATINLGGLDKAFKEGEEVTPQLLLAKGLIKKMNSGVKILGDGQLTKKLTVKANSFSKTALNAIIKAGGKAEIIKKLKTKRLKD